MIIYAIAGCYVGLSRRHLFYCPAKKTRAEVLNAFFAHLRDQDEARLRFMPSL